MSPAPDSISESDVDGRRDPPTGTLAGGVMLEGELKPVQVDRGHRKKAPGPAVAAPAPDSKLPGRPAPAPLAPPRGDGKLKVKEMRESALPSFERQGPTSASGCARCPGPGGGTGSIARS